MNFMDVQDRLDMQRHARVAQELEAQGVRLPKLRIAPRAKVEPVVAVEKPKRKMLLRDVLAARRTKVAKLWRQGMNTVEIGNALGEEARNIKNDIYYLQKADKIPRRNPVLRLSAEDAEKRRKAVWSLRAKGMTCRDIGVSLHISKSTVVNDLRGLEGGAA